MNVSRAHLLAALRFLDGPDGGGSGGTPPGDNGTPPAGAADGTGDDNGDRGSGDGTDPDDDEDPADKGDRQARRDANVRAKLKDTEAERDALAGRVEAYQRAEVERIAGGVLEQAADLFEVGGIALADVLTEDGEIDETEVLALTAALADSRPGLAKGARRPARGGHPDWGHSRSNVEGVGGTGPTWGEALIRREGSGTR